MVGWLIKHQLKNQTNPELNGFSQNFLKYEHFRFHDSIYPWYLVEHLSIGNARYVQLDGGVNPFEKY